MRIPHLLLTPAALRAVVEEYVTRDGTDHSVIHERIERVLRQLDGGNVELHYEQETATCNIVSISDSQSPRAVSKDL
jgi:uncharacterized protein YheU (UPF0270 family)